MKHIKMLLITALCLSLGLSLTGCRRVHQPPLSRSTFLFNTYITITLYEGGNNAILNQCIRICKDYEEIFSKTLEGSEIYNMNHRSGGQMEFELSDDTASLIATGLKYCEISGGAFDITIEPLSSLWDFTSGSAQVPDGADIAAAAARVDYRNLRLDGNYLTFLSPDTTIDLGSIANGYIADRLKDYLVEKHVESAIINLGGNVLCVGGLPDGTDFHIGLQKPFAGRTETFANVAVNGMSVVSSGVYERHFELDGVNYHHLLDPKTGYPYQNGLVSVTILSPRSVDGDALSTTCFSLGLEDGMALLDSIGDVCGIFVTEDGEIYYSEGAEEYVEAAGS